MKRTIIYCAVLLTTLFSCSDEFSNIPAVGALSQESLKNATGVDLLLTGAYSMLDGSNATLGDLEFWYASGDNWWFDVISDDSHKGSTDADQLLLFNLEVYDHSPSNDYFRSKFRALYAGLNRANAVISLINTIEGEGFTEKIAQARFLRAHFYFELQKIWGNVAIISVENYDALEFNQPNSGSAWSQIESDLQFAIDNLPNSQEQHGRPSAWTAKAFMGKALLYQSKWPAAYTILQDVVINGSYGLNPEFVDNFTGAGENGPESVFAIQFVADAGQSFNGNRGGALNFPSGGPTGCCGFNQPTQDLVNAYQTDGTGLPLLDTYNQTDVANDYNIFSDMPFTTETGTLDPRLDYTVGRRGIDYNGFGLNPGKEWVRANFGDISGPYLPKKNVYKASEIAAEQGTGPWGQNRSGMNYNIMRFADVLLMAAEAAVETGDLATALDYTNRVRTRAANSIPVMTVDGSGPAANYAITPYADFTDVDFARKAVRFERRLELAMEGHRLFDLKRWGITKQVLDEYTANEARTIPNFGAKIRPYNTALDLAPIPINAIDLSGGVLMQNPGY